MRELRLICKQRLRIELDQRVNGVYKELMIHVAPRERRHRANRKRILQSAAELIYDGGVEALSIKKVAQMADYTPGALYRYFPSKEALLAAVTVDGIEDLEAEVLNAAVPGESDLEHVVAQALTYCQFARRRPGVFGLLTAMMGQPRVLIAEASNAAPVAGAIIKAIVPMVRSLERAQETGVLTPGDATERTLLIWSGLQGALQLRKQERIAPQLINSNRLCRGMLRSLLMGFGVPAEVIDEALAKHPLEEEPRSEEAS